MKTIKLFFILIAACCMVKINAQPTQCQAAFTYSFGSAEGTGININFSFVPTSGAEVTSWEWNFGDTSSEGSNADTSALENPAHLYNHPGSYIVCLTIHAVNGCVNTACDTIFVPVTDPGPCYGLSAIWTYTTGQNGTVAFSGTPDNRNTVNYTWSFGDGTSGTGLNVTHAYTSSGRYNVCLIANLPNSFCADTSCAQVQVSSHTCNAAFSYSAAIGNPLTVSFTNASASSDSVVAWDWSFGDGATSHDKNPTHTYANYGGYKVCLNFGTSGGCQAGTCDTITISNPCSTLNAAWTSSISGSGNGVVEFNATGPFGISESWLWTFGDGSTGGGENVHHTYTRSGNYVVCLIASVPGTTCSDTVCKDIFVTVGTCKAAFAYAPGAAEGTGINIDFTSTSTSADSITSFAWNFGDAGSTGSNPNTSTLKNPVHLYNQGGKSYIVCLTINTVSNCASSICDTVNIPVIDPGPCYGLSAIWTDVVGNNGTIAFSGTPDNRNTANYSWNFGDGSTGSGLNVSHTYAHSGTYDVCLVADLPGSVCMDTSCAQVQVTLQQSCAANFTYAIVPDAFLLVNFTSTSSSTDSITSYDWVFGDGNSSNDKNPTHGYAGYGTYRICLYIGTANGCQSSICDSIHIPNPCTGLTPPSWTYTASGGSVKFNVTNPGLTGAYTWSFGDGSSGTGSDPTHTYSRSGTYDVCLISLGAGVPCSDTVCKEIAITTANSCNANFTYSAANNAPLTITFTNTSTASDSIVSYVWSFGNGVSLVGKNASYTYSEPGTYTVCLSIHTVSGCESSKCDTIEVQNPCGTILDAWTFTLPASPGGPGEFTTLGPVFQDYIYSWTFGDGSSGSGGTVDHQYSRSGTYQVCLVVSVAGTTCKDSNCVTITVPGSATCMANFTMAISQINPLTVNFNNTSTASDSIVSYVWSFGNGVSLVGKNASYTYAQSGTYVVCLSIRTIGGCESSKCDTITLGSPNPCQGLNANWTDNGNTGEPGLVFFNSVVSSVPGEYYNWTFGDGNTGLGSEVSNTYTHSGYYDVCLIATIRGQSCADTVCRQIYVDVPTCHANFTYVAEANVLWGFGFNSTSTSTDSIVSYEWSFGDGTSSSGKSTAHTYMNAGNYIVCLYIHTSGGCSSTKCDTINATGENHCSGLSAAWTYTLAGSASGTVEFHAPAGLALAQYTWSFGDGSTATGLNVSHTYTRSGTYNVCLVASIPGTPCADTSCKSLAIALTSCHANFAHLLASATGLTVAFVNESTSSDSIIAYDWSFGDGNTSHDKNPTHTYAQGGAYRVCLYIGTANGCQSGICDTVVLPSVSPCNLVIEVAWTSTQSIEFPGTVVFTASSARIGLTYKWSFGDGTTGTGNPVSHTYSHTGTYDVCLIAGIPGSACSDTVCQQVVLKSTHADCQAAFRYELLNTAVGVQFINTSASPDSITGYYWTFGDGTSSTLRNPDHIFPQQGTYITCLTIKAINGCVSEVCDTVYVDANTNICRASFTYSVIGTSVTGNTIYFENTSIGGYTNSQWSFGDGSASNEKNPTHTFDASKHFAVVCLTISNATGSCYSSVCDTVNITGESDCIKDSLIHLNEACPQYYLPVCGCNGVTYANECIAVNYFGVSSWTQGACRVHSLPGKERPEATARPDEQDVNIETAITNNGADQKFSLHIFPNPAGDKTTIAYTLNKQAPANITVLDLLGHEVAVIFQGTQETGLQTMEWNTANVTNGIYLVRVNVEGKFYTQRLSVIH